ncbi:MAG TPA: phosphopantetheine-binding protein [Actinophytocola sp.]|uniref:phosphopantetheine-binding protein n=1 Tax=Actinophytocola sp. TaxID=1872138 RepID=UPI002DDD2704|nr:phosphopantetheine-binding protein [Actinophytocola sp.]HEV2780404.1 phosphopantetheine-binding protein [Actinophytocola sp.]
MRADVAEVLHLDEVPADQNLFEIGLDSIRLMTLLERWRAVGAEVTFLELAERPTLDGWLPLLTTRTGTVPDAA